MGYFREEYAKLEGVESKYSELGQDDSLPGKLRLKNKSLGIMAQTMKEFPPKDESGLIGLTLEMITQRLDREDVNEGTTNRTVWSKLLQIGHEIGVDIIKQGENIYIKEINQN